MIIRFKQRACLVPIKVLIPASKSGCKNFLHDEPDVEFPAQKGGLFWHTFLWMNSTDYVVVNNAGLEFALLAP